MSETAMETPQPSRILRLLASDQMASWAGQGIVSATNFAVLLVMARFAGVEQVGLYAVGYSILALSMVTMDSLVTRPYAIQMFKPPGGSPQAHAHGTLALALSLSGLIGLVLAAVAGVLALSGSNPQLAALLAVLAVAAPLALTREFARRFSFANMLMRQAFALDAAVSALILLLLGGLSLAGWLSAQSALAAIGAAAVTGAALWYRFKRGAFLAVQGAFIQTARQSWAFGKWLLASQITLQLQGYAAHWITLIVAGAAATGVYSACLGIVSLSNPFLFGLFNLLTPKFVRIRREAGEAGLRAAAFRDALIIAAIMGGFALGLILWGDLLLSLLFPGEAFAGGASVLAILAVSSAVAAVGAPATIALSAAERGKAIAGLSFAAFVLGSAAVLTLILAWGLEGAAFGILITEILGTAARWALFLLSGRRAAASKPD